MVAAALDAGKHVFVEKPLAIDDAGLALVRETHRRCDHLQLMVGYNRRFSPLAIEMCEMLQNRTGSATALITVNAGSIPKDHWLHDPVVGGGRIVGEACHWFDLVCFLLDTEIVEVHAVAPAGGQPGDQATISMKMEDGSSATLHYITSGHRSYPKERIDVFVDGKVVTLDNFRRLNGYGWRKRRRKNLFRQDKGHRAEIRSFVANVSQGGAPLIRPSTLWNVTAATLCAMESLATGEAVGVSGG